MLRMLRGVIVCVLLGAVAASAATINVGPGQTYTTIQSGINAANNGDTVLVAPGTYLENIDFKGKAITVTSSGGAASTIIDGGDNGPGVTFKSSEPRTAVLSNMTVTHGGTIGANSYGQAGEGIFISNSQPTVLNNIIDKNYCLGIYTGESAPLIQGNQISNSLDSQTCPNDAGAGIYVSGNYASTLNLPAIIIGNTIEGNTTGLVGDGGGDGGAGIDVWGGNPIIESNTIRNNNAITGNGGAINIVYGTGITVTQNLIYGNNAGCGGGAIAFEGGGVGTPIYVLIANNTMVDNTGSSGGGYSNCVSISQIYPFPDTYGSSGPSAVFVNNIIAGSTSDPAVYCSGPSEAIQPIFDHNLLYNAGGSFFGSYCVDVSAKYGNVIANPNFINKSAGNYQLSVGSPAIDAGNNSALQIMQLMGVTPLSVDLAGNARVQDATGKGYPIIDMGAYEFGGLTETKPTTVVLSSSAYTGNAGPNYTLTATLSSALGVPTGSATFFMDGAQIGVSNIVGGVAVLPNVTIVPGVHSFYATYAGQGSFTPAISVIIIVDINLYATTVVLKSAPNPSLVGQNVAFTVTSSSTDTSYVPAPITLTDTTTNTVLATLTPSSTGAATFSTSALALGYHYITASYAGDLEHSSSGSSVDQDVVSGYPTNMTLKSSQNPSIVNQSVTFTAQVSSAVTGQGTPAGSIVFTYGSTVLGTVVMDSTGTASVSTSSLPLGYDTITATYQPSSTFTANAVTLSQQVISGYTTSTGLSSSLNPAKPGQTVVFTANVSSANGTPTGSIVFSDGATVVSTVVLASGVTNATWSSSTLTIAPHDITARFVPTGSFAASVGELIETIGYSTVTTTSDAPEPSTYGQPVMFSVHVAGVAAPAGTPTGIVVLEFCHGATIQLTLDASGNASVVTPTGNEISEPVGSCAYTANYQGDATFLASVSASTPYVVTPANSTTTVGASPNPGYAGQAVTLTAQVVGVPSPTVGPGGTILPPGSVVATGTVQFYDGVTPIGGAVTINAAGQASLTTNALVLGANTITAKYSGDTNLSASTSVGVSETIVQVGTTTTLIVAPNPGIQNEPVTMGVSVAALAGLAAPYGSVTIYDGTNVLTTLTLAGASGTVASANFATSGLAAGTHLLTAVYRPLCAAVICAITGFTGSQSSVVSLVIAPQDFSISANPPPITIETEYHKSMQLTLTPIGGFTAPISLSCAGTIPEWVTCEFGPQTVRLQGAGVPVTLTIDTDAMLDYKSDARGAGWGGRVVLAGLLPVMLLGFVRRRRGLRGLVVMAVASVMAMAMTACSGQYPAHTEPGTYTVTVQAEGTAVGAVSPTVHTVDVTLVVTP